MAATGTGSIIGRLVGNGVMVAIGAN